MTQIKIMVVDDIPSTRELIGNYLRKVGYSILEAGDGKEALQTAIQEHPDLIIADVVMPTMNGFELCRNLKKNPQTQHIKIIICSSKNQEIDRLWGIRQGADVYLTKPFTETEIVQTVKSLIA